MDDFKDILERADIQHIREFILNGHEETVKTKQSYHERITEHSRAIYRRMEKTFPDETELDAVIAELSRVFRDYETVYTEIGMKIGARILYQLLCQNEEVVAG